jgi:hypothetical protein
VPVSDRPVTVRAMYPLQLLDQLPIVAVFVLFAFVALVCFEGGYRIGRWWQEKTPDEKEGPTDMLVGSLLALVAFLLAVTMGMASDRFDTRRALVLEEANSIGTTYLRAGYLPEPASTEIRELLREYSRCASARLIAPRRRRTSRARHRSTPSSGRTSRNSPRRARIPNCWRCSSSHSTRRSTFMRPA